MKTYMVTATEIKEEIMYKEKQPASVIVSRGECNLDAAGRTMKYKLLVIAFSVLVPIAALAADMNKDLMKAAAAGDAATVNALLEKGANPNAKMTTSVFKDYTVLMISAEKGDAEVAKLLLAKGADPNAKASIIEEIDRLPGMMDAVFKAVAQENLNASSEGRIPDFDKTIDRTGAKYKKENAKFKLIGGWTALMAAAGNGKADVARLLLEKGAIGQDKDARGNDALIVAALAGQTEAVNVLIEKGLDVRTRNKNGTSPLLAAAERGHLATVKLLLEKGSDGNEKDQNGNNPLLLACKNGHSPVVGYLLEKGVDVKAKNKANQTAMRYALREHYIEAVKLLLNAGVEMNFKGADAAELLTGAAAKGDVDTVIFVLEKGVSPNIKNKEDDTALILAAEKGQTATMKVLIDRGADVNLTIYNRNAIGVALYEERIEAIKLLVKSGAMRDKKKYGPLLWAIMGGNAEAVKELIAKGANVNEKDKDSREIPAVVYAAMMGETEIVKLLVEKGAKINAKGLYDGETALIQAARNGRTETIRYLLEKGADIKGENREAVIQASKMGWDDVVRLFIEKGVDISTAVSYETALGNAVMYRRTSTVSVLLEGGAKVDASTAYKGGLVSPLIIAAMNDDVEIAKLLMAKGADVNKVHADKTVLRIARDSNAQKMVTLLTSAGAKE